MDQSVPLATIDVSDAVAIFKEAVSSTHCVEDALTIARISETYAIKLMSVADSARAKADAIVEGE